MLLFGELVLSIEKDRKQERYLGNRTTNKCAKRPEISLLSVAHRRQPCARREVLNSFYS